MLSQGGESRSYPELFFPSYPGGVGERKSLSYNLSSVLSRLNITRMPKRWTFLREKAVENVSSSPSVAPEQGSTLDESEVNPCLVAEEIVLCVFNNFSMFRIVKYSLLKKV